MNSFYAYFNRFFLRYGPCSLVGAWFVWHWKIFEDIGAIPRGVAEAICPHPPWSLTPCPSANILTSLIDMANTTSWQQIGLTAVAGVGLSYLCTWPVHFLHVFRFDAQTIKRLSQIRLHASKGRGNGEFTDTYRHVREYGNSWACAGSTALHFIFVGKIFDREIGHWPMVAMAGNFLVITGTLAWFRGVFLEGLLLDQRYRQKGWHAILAGMFAFGLVIFDALIIASFPWPQDKNWPSWLSLLRACGVLIRQNISLFVVLIALVLVGASNWRQAKEWLCRKICGPRT